MSRPVQESTQSLIPGLTGFFPRSEREVHHSVVVPRLRIRGFVLELPQCARTTLLLITALFRVITQRGVEICGNKTRCKMKTNGYLIFNYSNLDVYEP